jgi:hypothetical protein
MFLYEGRPFDGIECIVSQAKDGSRERQWRIRF